MQVSTNGSRMRSHIGTKSVRVGLGMFAAVAIACSSAVPSNIGTTSDAVTPSSGWSGCSGTFDTTQSPTGAYFITDFGCSSSPYFTDDSDNCCPNGVVQASADGLCAGGTTTAGCTDNVGTSASIACERAVNWFSTGGSAFGMGTRLQLTRPDTGASVVVFVIDNGPACYREQQFGGYALDISYPAIIALYGEEEGVSDRATVTVTVVPSSTPLGLVTSATFVDSGAPGAPEAGGNQDAGTQQSDASEVDEAAPSGDDASTGTSCATDGDCNPGSDGSGMICTNGVCVTGCNADWECPGATSCVSGTCQ
jgi:hypothetical protein